MTGRIMRRVVGLAAVSGAVLFAPAAGAATAPTAPTWAPQTQLAYSGENVDLESISATTNGDVWATGYVYTGIEFRTLALRRHAGTWARMSTPDIETEPAQDFLNGVSALAPDNVWMVGSSATSQTSLVEKPLVEHWDGSAVSIVPVPDPSDGRGAAFEAVSGSSNDLWAVGDGENVDFNSAGEVEHFNGKTWSVVPFSSVAPGCNDVRGSSLDSVVDVGRGDVYVGGWCFTPKSQIGFVEHFTSGLWTLSATTPVIGQITSLTEAPDGSVWAVGTQQSSGGGAGWLRGIALHGSGPTFVTVDQPVPKEGVYDGFYGVSAAGPGVVAVGLGTSPQPPFAGFGAYTLSGSTWGADVVKSPFAGFGRFAAVTRDAGGHMLAAGFGLTSSGDEVGIVSVEKSCGWSTPKTRPRGRSVGGAR